MFVDFRIHLGQYAEGNFVKCKLLGCLKHNPFWKLGAAVRDSERIHNSQIWSLMLYHLSYVNKL